MGMRLCRGAGVKRLDWSSGVDGGAAVNGLKPGMKLGRRPGRGKPNGSDLAAVGGMLAGREAEVGGIADCAVSSVSS